MIGSGPAGQKAAIAAAKARKHVAVIDRTTMIGGVSVHTGTIPSKTVREAIFQLTGSAVNGNRYKTQDEISREELSLRVKEITGRETKVIRAQLKRNGVSIYEGNAQFLDPHTVEVQSDTGGTKLEAEQILIASGTRPAHDPEIPFDNQSIIDADHLPGLGQVPREIVIVGAGVVGLEYASFMAAGGVDVVLIDQRSVILDFVDREIAEALFYHLRRLGVTFRLGEKVTRVGRDATRNRVFAELESGKKVLSDACCMQ